jgi:hypothetical protein
VAGSFDYVFHLMNCRQRGEKKLKSIYEIGLRDDGHGNMKPYADEILSYDQEKDTWKWSYRISDEKRKAAMEEDTEAFAAFEKQLRHLAKETSEK